MDRVKLSVCLSMWLRGHSLKASYEAVDQLAREIYKSAGQTGDLASFMAKSL